MEVEGVAAIVAESRYLWRMDSEETRRLLLVGDVMGNSGEGGWYVIVLRTIVVEASDNNGYGCDGTSADVIRSGQCKRFDGEMGIYG